MASRLSIALDDEYLRMQNEWFFKWHFIGRDEPVEIDSFDGRMISYCGIGFSGSAHNVYWQTIQRYLRKKIGSIFDDIESELPNYPVQTREDSLNEIRHIVGRFAAKIRRASIEKDRTLRGNGIEFPPERDFGRWEGSGQSEIDARISSLLEIYCDVKIMIEGVEMSLQSMKTEKLTLVKKDGAVFREDIPGLVTNSQVTIFAKELPIEPGDHFLRKLPNGLVDDFIVIDPGFHGGLGSIKPHFQAKVKRSDIATDSPKTVIQSITNNFHGPNARVNIDSTDNSINVAGDITVEQLKDFVDQLRPAIDGLPVPQREQIVPTLGILEDETKNPKPSQSKVRGALQSIKNVAEGATGNLMAAGISGLIGKLLSGS